MTRAASVTTTGAVAQDVTRPIYLIYMAWDTPVRYATWASNIPWDSQTWLAGPGLELSKLSANGGTLKMPMGETEPWLALVRSEIARDRAISVYEYHTDFSASPVASDAELIFSGVMDGVQITHSGIQVSLIESRTNKAFPPGSIDPPTYNYLLPIGSRIFWRNDVITAT